MELNNGLHLSESIPSINCILGRTNFFPWNNEKKGNNTGTRRSVSIVALFCSVPMSLFYKEKGVIKRMISGWAVGGGGRIHGFSFTVEPPWSQRADVYAANVWLLRLVYR